MDTKYRDVRFRWVVPDDAAAICEFLESRGIHTVGDIVSYVASGWSLDDLPDAPKGAHKLITFYLLRNIAKVLGLGFVDPPHFSKESESPVVPDGCGI